jgi:hypothetical protein
LQIKAKSALLTSLQEFLFKAGVTRASTAEIVAFVGRVDQKVFENKHYIKDDQGKDTASEFGPFRTFLANLADAIEDSNNDALLFDTLSFVDGKDPTGGAAAFRPALAGYIRNFLWPVAENKIDTVIQEAKEAQTTQVTLTAEQTKNISQSEGIILVVQNSNTTSINDIVESSDGGVTFTLTTATETQLSGMVDEVTTAIEEIVTSVNSQRKTLIEEELYLVPAVMANATPDRSLNGVTDFNMTYSDPNNSITISSTTWSPFDNQILTFNAEGRGYFYDNESNKIGITLSFSQLIPDENGIYPDQASSVSGRVLTYSVDNGATQHIAMLATKEEICGADFAELRASTAWDALGVKTLLDVVNDINSKPEIVCAAEE